MCSTLLAGDPYGVGRFVPTELVTSQAEYLALPTSVNDNIQTDFVPWRSMEFASLGNDGIRRGDRHICGTGEGTGANRDLRFGVRRLMR